MCVDRGKGERRGAQQKDTDLHQAVFGRFVLSAWVAAIAA